MTALSDISTPADSLLYINPLKKQKKVKEYERQIDQMVYKLYGLTESEIQIIEQSVTNEK